MRILRYLIAAALVCGLAGVAKADDFQMVVGDPTVPIYVIQPVYTDSFSLNFPTTGPAAGCGAPGQLPSSVPDPQDYTACFTGINLTGNALTSLQIEFPVFDFPGTSTPDSPNCPKLASGDVFSNISCGLTNGGADYLLQFSGGDIPTATFSNTFCYPVPFDIDCNSPAIFTIAFGIPGASAQGQDQVITMLDSESITADANAVVTPEPSSVLLMSTGLLSIGLFGTYRRRQSLGEPLPLASRKVG
jgi:hypothetical protein